jgi:hypothetical protein
MNKDELVKRVLRGISIRKDSGFELPRLRYLDVYRRYSAPENSVLLNKIETGKRIEKFRTDKFLPRQEDLKKMPLEFSKLNYGMFNATVDLGTAVNIPALFQAIVQRGLVDTQSVKCLKVSTIYGKFAKATEITNEYGLRELKKVDPKKLTGVEFILRSKGQGASLTVFNTGRIRFSGGYHDGSDRDPARILGFISANYFSIPGNIKPKINNNTTGFEMNMGIDRVGIAILFDRSRGRGQTRFGKYTVISSFPPLTDYGGRKKPPGKTEFLYLAVTDDNKKEFTLVCSRVGTVMIEGTSQIAESYALAKKLFEGFKNIDLLLPGKGQNIRNNRGPRKNSKIVRRANNKPAPDITRRGATCPSGKRPDPYSFQGKCPPGYYVRPNPQGQPCCYKIPKKLGYIKNKVATRYLKAGVRVPDNVRRLFNIRNDPLLPNNVTGQAPNIQTFVNNKSGFMIDSRQCKRYTKVGLVDIAKRLGIQVPRVITKPKLCDMIKQATNPERRAPGNVREGPNGLKLSGRYCTSYKKSTLLKYARELKIQVDSDASKEQICVLIAAPRNIRKKLAREFVGGNKSVTQENVNAIKNLIKGAGSDTNKNKIIKNYVSKKEKELNNLLNQFV